MKSSRRLVEESICELLPFPEGVNHETWRAFMMARVFDAAAAADVSGRSFKVLNAVLQRVLGFKNYGPKYLDCGQLAKSLAIPGRTVRDALEKLEDAQILDIERADGRVVSIRLHPRFFAKPGTPAPIRRAVDNYSHRKISRRARQKIAAFAPPRTPFDPSLLYSVGPNQPAVDNSPPGAPGGAAAAREGGNGARPLLDLMLSAQLDHGSGAGPSTSQAAGAPAPGTATAQGARPGRVAAVLKFVGKFLGGGET